MCSGHRPIFGGADGIQRSPSGPGNSERGPSMGSIEWNRLMWGNIDNWSASGDCWDFHAKSCGQPYEDWKNSVVTEFVTPYLGPEVDVVEIGPGQGRWTQYIVAQARTV